MPVNLWCWIVWILTHRAAKTVRRGVRKKGRRRKVVGKWATQGENAQEQKPPATILQIDACPVVTSLIYTLL